VKNMDQLIGQIEETRAEVGGYIAKNPNISTTQDSMNLTTMGPQPKQATTSVTREHVNAANTSSDSKIWSVIKHPRIGFTEPPYTWG
jgi:hypothetical protein